MFWKHLQLFPIDLKLVSEMILGKSDLVSSPIILTTSFSSVL